VVQRPGHRAHRGPAPTKGIMRELWHPKPLRWWIPVSLVLVAVAAYAVFVVIGYLERQGASSLGFINVVGLMLVVLGVVAAGAILRRASPPT